MNYLECQNNPDVTAKLNQIYSSGKNSRLDPVLDELHRAALTRSDW